VANRKKLPSASAKRRRVMPCCSGRTSRLDCNGSMTSGLWTPGATIKR
jgi:hypothetical protein